MQMMSNLTVLLAVRGVSHGMEKTITSKAGHHSDALESINPIKYLQSAAALLEECNELIKLEIAQKHVAPFFTYKEQYGRIKSIPTGRATESYGAYDVLTLPQLLLSHLFSVVSTSIILLFTIGQHLQKYRACCSEVN
jgi:hypothetical protein